MYFTSSIRDQTKIVQRVSTGSFASHLIVSAPCIIIDTLIRTAKWIKKNRFRSVFRFLRFVILRARTIQRPVSPGFFLTFYFIAKSLTVCRKALVLRRRSRAGAKFLIFSRKKYIGRGCGGRVNCFVVFFYRSKKKVGDNCSGDKIWLRVYSAGLVDSFFLN